MAKYKCKNCGRQFSIHQATRPRSLPKCINCGSRWTEYVGPGNVRSPWRPNPYYTPPRNWGSPIRVKYTDIGERIA